MVQIPRRERFGGICHDADRNGAVHFNSKVPSLPTSGIAFSRTVAPRRFDRAPPFGSDRRRDRIEGVGHGLNVPAVAVCSCSSSRRQATTRSREHCDVMIVSHGGIPRISFEFSNRPTGGASVVMHDSMRARSRGDTAPRAASRRAVSRTDVLLIASAPFFDNTTVARRRDSLAPFGLATNPRAARRFNASDNVDVAIPRCFASLPGAIGVFSSRWESIEPSRAERRVSAERRR